MNHWKTILKRSAPHTLKLFGHPTECDFEGLMAKLLPTAVEVVSIFNFKYTDDDFAQVHEERVAGYLQMFLTSLSQEDLMVFLCFISGAEIMPASIIVEFNGESNEEQMIPTAHTCATSIHLSRFFLTYESLATNLKNLKALCSQISNFRL